MNRFEVLDAARSALVDRNDTHGEADVCFRRIALFWGAYLDREIALKDVAAMMILVKVARSQAGHNGDDWIDISGYGALGGELSSK